MRNAMPRRRNPSHRVKQTKPFFGSGETKFPSLSLFFRKNQLFNNLLLLDYKYALGSGQHFLLLLEISEKRPFSTMNLY
jgi:hypothetical protein